MLKTASIREGVVMAKAGRGAAQFSLRLPDGLRNKIKQSAEKNNRSMNSEIINILEVHQQRNFDSPIAYPSGNSDRWVVTAAPTSPEEMHQGKVNVFYAKK